MARLSRRTKIGIAAITLAVGAIACGPAFLPPERHLISEAKKITAIGSTRYTTSVWRTDHTVLQMSYHKDGDRFAFVELDTNTGSQKPLDELSNKYRTDLGAVYQLAPYLPSGISPPRLQPVAPEYAVSPNGQSLIFAPVSTSQGLTYIFASLDGTKGPRWRSEESWQRPLWLHDNRRWLESRYESSQGRLACEVVVHDMQRPALSTVISIPGAPNRDVIDIVGITRQQRMLGFEVMFGKPTQSAQLTDYDIAVPATPSHKREILLPRFSIPEDLVLSINGDRLAWLLEYDDAPPISRWLHALVPQFPSPPRPTLALYVSGLNGTGMTEIGHKTVTPDLPMELEIRNLQWLPGDKKLSFTYDGALYTVPVL